MAVANSAPPSPPPPTASPPASPKLPVCCISHLFHKAASKSPDKIAVIHASGGAKIISEQYDNHFNSVHETTVVSDPKLAESKTMSSQSSPKPPVYEGDQCFTYSEILSAVNSLSSRLRCILDGADDPHIIKPRSGYLPHEQPSVSGSNSEFLESSDKSVHQFTQFQHKYMPRRIGIYMEPSVEYIVAVLSVIRCGAAFMPLDPSWPEERTMSVVSSSKPDLIIGCESLVDDGYFHKLDRVQWLVSSGYCSVLCISMRDCVQEQSHLGSLICPCESEMSRLFCYLMYTSGSTGKPKGVCGTEAGLLNRFLWMQDLYPLCGEEYVVFKTSISFIDHLQEFLSGILTASTLVVPPFNELKENILCVVDFLQMYTVNRLVAVPSLMRMLLLPLQSSEYTRLCNSLKLLVLSGEVLHLPLCQRLLELLPHTTILNLYGSTEVSGDCTFFDCKKLPWILENETISSVPIGLPISNCDVVLIGEKSPDYGEIHVHGLCNGAGYFDYYSITPLDSAELPQNSCFTSTCINQRPQDYFKTGDFARQLQSGDFIFIGREDRTLKLNGQRIALEEVEDTFRQHSDIVDAAVICPKNHGEFSHIEAHLVLKKEEDCNEKFKAMIRSWMVKKLPQTIVPRRIFFTKSFPTSSSGKVDYTKLAGFASSKAHAGNAIGEIWDSDLLDVIKKVFCEALMTKNISSGDNFFHMGGTSISAAYVAYNLGINMKLLYAFPTPLELKIALQRNIRSSDGNPRIDENVKMDSGATDGKLPPVYSGSARLHGTKTNGRLFGAIDDSSTYHPVKFLKRDSSLHIVPRDGNLKYSGFWNPESLHTACSFSRCNKVMHRECGNKKISPIVSSQQVSLEGKGSIREIWKVHMESCVDASPLIVCNGSEVYLFIGSHSKKFVCVDARSGFVVWEIKLNGRIESSAAVLDDFSQLDATEDTSIFCIC